MPLRGDVLMRLIAAVVLTLVFLPMLVTADTLDEAAEIEYLLTSIGTSDCNFVRNGKRYDANAAESHLRMKLRRGKRYVTTAETFIERLASRSSLSKKPYSIECPGVAPVPSEQWLKSQLSKRRTKLNRAGSLIRPLKNHKGH